MAKGISIPIASDTREFASGVRDGVIDPLQDADKELSKLGKGGELNDLERDMAGAQKATSEFSKEVDKARDNLRQAQRQSHSFSDDTKEGFRDAGHYSGEFKDEALQNFSEVTSSFDGSMDSILDLAQGTFGGLASLGGPVGLAAGAMAAILGGVFTGMTQSAQEEAEKTAQAISDMYDDMTDSGNKYLSEDFISKKIHDLIDDHDQLKAAQDGAAAAGISVQTVLRAMAGDGDALSKALAATNSKYDELSDASVGYGGAAVQLTHEQQEQFTAITDLQKALRDVQGQTDSAAKQSDLFRQATSDTSAAMADASKKAADLKGKLDSFHDVNVKVSVDDAAARERLRQLGKAINVDMFVTPRTGRGIN